MTLKEIKEILNADTLWTHSDADILVERAYCADLMSDVLCFSITNSLLITHLTNTQVIRTADVANIRAIVFCQGKIPPSETLALAARKKIPMLVTSFSMFDSCGRLYERGLRSRSDSDI